MVYNATVKKNYKNRANKPIKLFPSCHKHTVDVME